MEKHLSSSSISSEANQNPQAQRPQSDSEFTPGTLVIYGVHGKCTITQIENRQVGTQVLRFYKLEMLKSALSRSTRQEPAIWLPVLSARERGLRLPTSKEESAAVMAVLSNREYYFPLNDNWSAVTPKLEASIRLEGAIGLAKVTSYLYVLRKKLIVLPTEISRFQELVHKLLFRELSEALGEPIRTIEEKATKAMRQKLLPDN